MPAQKLSDNDHSGSGSVLAKKRSAVHDCFDGSQ